MGKLASVVDHIKAHQGDQRSNDKASLGRPFLHNGVTMPLNFKIPHNETEESHN